MLRMQALANFYDQPEMQRIETFVMDSTMNIRHMSTDELLMRYLTRPSESVIEDLHLTWWAQDVSNEFDLRPDFPHLLSIWSRDIQIHHRQRYRRSSLRRCG